MTDKRNINKKSSKRSSFKKIPLILLFLLIGWLLFVPQLRASTNVPPSSILYVSPYLNTHKFINVQWSFPTKFTLGIIGEHLLKQRAEISNAPLLPQNSSIDLFPCYFIMKYPLYETQWLSQNIGMGLGPYFLHEGPGAPELDGLKITGNSTWVMEWISQISQYLFLNLSMKYTQAFHAALKEVPLRSFSTLLSLQLNW